MVETHSQRSKREVKEDQEFANMSAYEYENDIFFNFDRNTLPNTENYGKIENNDNNDNTNKNENDDNIEVHLYIL